jgi:DNA-binding IclR family transcriptional regulator
MIRAQGYDWSFEEFTEGLVVVAAPIFDAQEAVIASIYVCGPTMRFPPAGKEQEITQLIVSTCQEITKLIATRQIQAKQ